MGRKGDSKRKSKQSNSKPVSGGTVSSMVKASEIQPIRTLDENKSIRSGKGGGKTSSDRGKNTKKG